MIDVAPIAQGGVRRGHRLGDHRVVHRAGIVPIPQPARDPGDRGQIGEAASRHAIDLAIAVGVHQHARQDRTIEFVEQRGAIGRGAVEGVHRRQQPDQLRGVVRIHHRRLGDRPVAGEPRGSEPSPADEGVGVLDRGLDHRHPGDAVIVGGAAIEPVGRIDIGDGEATAGPGPRVEDRGQPWALVGQL